MKSHIYFISTYSILVAISATNCYLGVVITVVMSTIYILLGDFNELVDYFSFAAWVFYFITVLGLLRLRCTMPDVKREFKVPIVIPILFCICALYLIIAPLIGEFEDPWEKLKYIAAVMFILAGFVYYLPFVLLGVRVKSIHGFYKNLQYALNIATSYYQEDEPGAESEQEKVRVTFAIFKLTTPAYYDSRFFISCGQCQLILINIHVYLLCLQ